MVEIWYIHPIYWLILLPFFAIFLRLLDAPLLTPYFLTALFLSQSLAVLIIEFSRVSYLSIIGITGIFAFSIAQIINLEKRIRFRAYNNLVINIDNIYHVQLKKNYLAYFIIMIITLMFFNVDWGNGFLSLISQTEDERSLDRKGNIFIALTALGLPSLISLLILKKSVNVYLKVFTLTIYSFQLLLSGSKSGFASIIIILFGFLYWTKFNVKNKYILVGVVLVLLGPFTVFTLYSERFGINSGDITNIFDSLYLFFDKLVYRIVANNDQLELLIYSDSSIYNYPFYGPLQLIDPLIKAIGLRSFGFQYSPGEWLYGINYGNWSGVGPNPTFIIEFPQAVGPLSIVLMYFIGRIFKFVRLQNNFDFYFPIYCTLPVMIVDISLFEMKIIGYFFLLSIIITAIVIINTVKKLVVNGL